MSVRKCYILVHTVGMHKIVNSKNQEKNPKKKKINDLVGEPAFVIVIFV